MSDKLWSLEEIAQYASYGLTRARMIVAQPDFPSPVRLFNGAHPRWIAREVIEWEKSRKESGRELLEDGSRYTALYRHFNKEGRLLYVGVSVRVLQRIAEHRMGCGWYRHIARIEIQWFNSRSEALEAEEEAIRKEHPLYNISPGTRRRNAATDTVSRR